MDLYKVRRVGACSLAIDEKATPEDVAQWHLEHGDGVRVYGYNKSMDYAGLVHKKDHTHQGIMSDIEPIPEQKEHMHINGEFIEFSKVQDKILEIMGESSFDINPTMGPESSIRMKSDDEVLAEKKEEMLDALTKSIEKTLSDPSLFRIFGYKLW